MISVTSSSAMDVGHMRQHMEDGLYINEESHLYAVIDGMGGHRTGIIITQFICDHLKAYSQEMSVDVAHEASTRPDELWKALNQGFLDYQKNHPELKGQGASCAMLRLTPAGAVVSHIGDARVYRWRAGELTHVTRDHSLNNYYPGLALDVSDSAHYGHVITRAIGMEEDAYLATHSVLQVLPGDRFLLCTDGATKDLSHDALAHVMGEGVAVDLATSVLEAVLETRASDNIAIVSVDVNAFAFTRPTRAPLDFGVWRGALHDRRMGQWERIVALCDDHALTAAQLHYARDMLQADSHTDRPTPTHWLFDVLHDLQPRPELALCDTFAPVSGMRMDASSFFEIMTHPDMQHITSIVCGYDTLSAEILEALATHPLAQRLTQLTWHQSEMRDPRTIDALLRSPMLSAEIKDPIDPLTDKETELLAQLRA